MSRPPRIAILGAGIAGLSHAYYLKQFYADLDLVVLEGSQRVGGCINTVRRNGFTIEQGARVIPPRGKGQAVLELVEELGLSAELLRANPSCLRRYLYRAGDMQHVPVHPLRFFLSPAMRGRWRAVLNDLRASPLSREDESVADFVRRHFGESILENVFKPFITGTRGGDAERLSAKFVLPILTRLEREHGSVLRGWWREYRKTVFGASDKSVYITMRDGLSSIPDALAECLGGALRLGSSIKGIEREASGSYSVWTETECYEVDAIISTLPALVLSNLVASLSPKLASSLSRVQYAPMAVVTLGFDSEPHNYTGFGYLVGDSSEGGGSRGILGASWNEQIFPERAPHPGATTITANVGGTQFRDFSSWNNSDFIRLVRRGVSRHLKLFARPYFAVCNRYPHAMPQFNVGYASLLDDIATSTPPGFFVRGNFIQGIAIGDIVRTSKAFAEDFTVLKPESVSPTTKAQNLHLAA